MPHRLILSILLFLFASLVTLLSAQPVGVKAQTTLTLIIPQGASVQGNPDYEPDEAKVPLNGNIVWVNKDTVPHTATSGTGAEDPNSGKIFDTSIINGGEESSPVQITGVKEGDEIPYYCQVHPYMTSKLTVDGASTSIPTTTIGGDIDNASVSNNVTIAPITLTIPQGASVQGNPAYDPDPLTVKVGDTIAVNNEDIAPHTVTNGKDATDPNMGRLFDTSIINAKGSGEIVTADMKPGEYPYHCSVHPYMTGTLIVQSTVSSSADADQNVPMEGRMANQKLANITVGNEQPDITVTADPYLINELLNAAMENLQSGNSERALVYMDFVRQQLLLQAKNLSMPKSTEVLVTDAIDSLQKGDSNTASLFLNQAHDQLAVLTGSNQTSFSDGIETISGNKTVQNTTETAGIKEPPILGNQTTIITPEDITEEKSFTTAERATGANMTVALKGVFSDNNIDTYNITKDNITFPIKYHVEGATVNNITADQNQTAVDISSFDDGALTIEIPQDFMDSKRRGNVDEEFIVLADGQQIGWDEINSNNRSRILTVYFENGVEQIEILNATTVHPMLNNNAESMKTLQRPPLQIPNTMTTNPAEKNDTIKSSNANVTDWSKYTDAQGRFSLEYPAHWEVTTTGNRFLDELPFTALDSKGDISKVQSQINVNVVEGIPIFNTMQMARFGLNILDDDNSSFKLVESITCDKYSVDGNQACSFVYATDDDLGRRIGILTVVVIDDGGLVHMIGYRADPENFDAEQAIMDHIISSYKFTSDQIRNNTGQIGSERFY
jgi:plastocyanin